VRITFFAFVFIYFCFFGGGVGGGGGGVVIVAVVVVVCACVCQRTSLHPAFLFNPPTFFISIFELSLEEASLSLALALNSTSLSQLPNGV
jgi:hypothetical protein